MGEAMDERIEGIAGMMGGGEGGEGGGGSPSTPSQIFSQALLHGWDFARPMHEAIVEVVNVGKSLGLSAELIDAAVAYTQQAYAEYQG
jgi:hypothetical protein